MEILTISVSSGYVGIPNSITWTTQGTVPKGTTYEIQVNRGEEWEPLKEGLTTTRFIETVEQESSHTQYRVRHQNTPQDENTEIEWTYSPIISYKAKDDPVQTLGQGSKEIHSVIRLQANHILQELNARTYVQKVGADELKSMFTVPVHSSMRIYQEMTPPILTMDTLGIEKDTTNREYGATLNYGTSQQLVIGSEPQGRFETYVGINYQRPKFPSIQIEKIELVFKRVYRNANPTQYVLREVKGKWDEYMTTWVYKPKAGKVIAEGSIQPGQGDLVIDVTNAEWYHNRTTSFCLETKRQGAPKVTFGSRESNDAPELRIHYYKMYSSAESDTFKASTQVRALRHADLPSVLDVAGGITHEHLRALLELYPNIDNLDIDSKFTVSVRMVQEIAAMTSLILKNKDREIPISTTVPYREFLPAIIELVGKDKELNLEAKALIRQYVEEDIDVTTEISGKREIAMLDSFVTLVERRLDEINASIELEIKEKYEELTSNLHVRAIGKDDLDSLLTLELKERAEELVSKVYVRAIGEEYLETSTEVPRYDELIDIDSELIVPYREFIDATLEITEKDTNTDLESLFEIINKEQYNFLDSSIVVRAFWADQLEATIKIMQLVHLDSKLALKNKNRNAELDAKIRIPGDNPGSNNFAFII